MRGRRIAVVFMVVAASACDQASMPTSPGQGPSFATTVPGHQSSRYDADSNGFPDAGVTVTGVYSFEYAYGASVCKYQVQYRGTFENDAYLDTGWIRNSINCRGQDHGTYNYLIVHETDPRYTGNPDWAEWGTWEYHVLTESGSGNIVRARPVTH